MQDKRILIGCPIGANRDWVLPYYLRNLYNLKYNKSLIDIYWIINNLSNDDNSLSILREFRDKYKNEYNSITIEITNSNDKFIDERSNKIRESKTYSWLSFLRNTIFGKCKKLNCDFLLSIDSDILVKPFLLNDLLQVNSPIIASLIWNGYLFSPDMPWDYTNILKYENGKYVHIKNWYTKNPDKAPKDKIIPIDATGAVCLYSREVCENTYYKWHIQGEDLGWADVCREKDYKMVALPHCFSQHIMSPQFLEQFKDFGME